MLNGIIIQSVSGFYYVEAADAVYTCKAKGSFRKDKLTPLTGDYVEIEVNGERGTVSSIADRKNFLVRPPVANIDTLFIVASPDKPKPNIFVIDKLTAFAVFHGIKPVIIISKCDLSEYEELEALYSKAGFKVICSSAKDNLGFDEIKSELNGKTCAFSGNSGVGKSSIINRLIPGLNLETNEISDKLGRGKHTTRTVTLYKAFGGYIADTPGFSSLEFDENVERIYKDELAGCFPDFYPFLSECKFGTSCSHTTDKGCGIIRAVSQGLIPQQRHNSYCKMYEDVKTFKKWEIKP